MSRELLPAAVLVPASTSNLGAGFDCLGLALNRYLRAEYLPGTGPLRLERGGELDNLGGSPDEDLLTRAFTAALARRGIAGVTGELRAESDIPVGRGLGASGAAVLAGLCLAAWAVGEEEERSSLLQQAVGWEGHPDNAAPSLLGGLVGIVRDLDGSFYPFQLPLSARIGFAFAAPGEKLATSWARSVLPRVLPYGEAAQGLGRLAALLHGLASGDAALLRIGFADRFHVPHRLPLIPGGAAAIQAAEDAGAWATTISGSGSGLFAVCPPDRTEIVAQAMAEALRQAAGGPGVVAFSAVADTLGARRGSKR